MRKGLPKCPRIRLLGLRRMTDGRRSETGWLRAVYRKSSASESIQILVVRTLYRCLAFVRESLSLLIPPIISVKYFGNCDVYHNFYRMIRNAHDTNYLVEYLRKLY